MPQTKCKKDIVQICNDFEQLVESNRVNPLVNDIRNFLFDAVVAISELQRGRCNHSTLFGSTTVFPLT